MAGFTQNTDFWNISRNDFFITCLEKILDFHSRDERTMLVYKTMANVAQVLHNNEMKFPKDFFGYCSVHQH